MSEGNITTEGRGHVLLIGIDRAAKRNAFDLQMLRMLAEAYTELERNEELRCGVLFAHGDHFTGGLDLANVAPAMANGNFGLPEGAIDPMGVTPPYRTKPVVVALQGICFTIGIELMLYCDIRIAAKDVRFAQIEIKRGIYPVGGATIRFAQEVGWGNAMRYLLTADEFGADEALRMGLVQQVVEPGKQLETAVAIAETIAAQAPLGVRATMISARRTFHEGAEEAARRLLPDLKPMFETADAAEGMQAFLQRRPGVFTGK